MITLSTVCLVHEKTELLDPVRGGILRCIQNKNVIAGIV